ncbi:uncharacterized protein LOC134197828 [Corticium candelabrum]|uniref:uncharacterized protein LOC134197828 n=1 Tax=Corticium candelabrum TaxID=121492 RepID=UPI002E2534F4|nr:uncharacterized protein LOC134197828 [Corticium candelabrum]
MANTACSVSLIYSAVVLIMTAIWVRAVRHKSFAFMAYAMYFPTAVAIIFSVFISGDFLQFLSRALVIQDLNHFFTVTQSMVYGALVDAGIIGGCAVVALALKWGHYSNTSGQGAIHEHNREMLSAFLRAAGEEIGWRSYLLPQLMSCYSTAAALLISGVVWGLYHVPVMILMVQQMKVRARFATVLVQCLSCCLAAFPYGYVAVRCGYSVLPAAFTHFFWNRLNPLVLGSIYTNDNGMIVGEQWKINGEGLLGCIVSLPVVYAVVHGI